MPDTPDGRPGGGGVSTRLKAIGREFRREIAFWKLVWRDRRTPKLAKGLLGLAIGYALSPIDLIPDCIPVLGQLDDALIILALLSIARAMIPKTVIEDCRRIARS